MNEKKKAQFEELRRLAGELGVEILAHFYQRAEVKAAADFVGGTSEVVERAVSSPARAVMLCGASFMGLAAQRRRPRAELLLPRTDLSCPLAEKVSPEMLQEARNKYPQALVLADIKVPEALRGQADVIISPTTLPQRLAECGDRDFIVLPGAQLLDWAGLGDRVVQRWPQAVCQVHELARPEELAAARAGHPEAKAAVHFLCRPELWKMADYVGDSAGIRDYCARESGPEFIVVCEAGLAEYLAVIFPGKRFYESEAEIFCPNMKLTTLKSMLARLTDYARSAGREQAP
ncbi:MAG: quinolinate synthase NadA [Candidatus Adiutrix sp.]|jgi:quinolinate synthase|nr:quinolinate synthase NadA [Candidatus Adiutrix sp.]